TGAADWPRPQLPVAANAAAANAPLAERYPSFWNHLMTNTTRYRLQGARAAVLFDLYFQADGTVTGSRPELRGFWRELPGEVFCYALQGVPFDELPQIIECFPVVAMSIPRFGEALWTTEPRPGIKLTGGILAGRPERGAEAP
ncbi:MAG: hypothetical protein NZM12_02610, partial [Steroidobacteraceae bacterium]|nr:hypothetical protein [Steroidobacteraceae bacterium]